MLFYEPLFLFLFAPAVYLLYLAVGARRASRALVLLLASIVFYAWSEPVFVFVVFASVALDLFVARRIFALREGRRRGQTGWRSASAPISAFSSIINTPAFSP